MTIQTGKKRGRPAGQTPQQRYEAAIAKANEAKVKAENALAVAQAAERMKTDPRYQSMLATRTLLARARQTCRTAENGYTNGKTGVEVTPSLAKRIDNMRRELARLEAMAERMATLPEEVEAALILADAALVAICKGEEFIPPIVPDVFREDGAAVPAEHSFVASEQDAGNDPTTGESE